MAQSSPPVVVGSQLVSVPFTRGTPLWPNRAFRMIWFMSVSVPFTRGTPLWLPSSAEQRISVHPVSVPFTRGTPLWRRKLWRPSPRKTSFQSPSRGGHLCGTGSMSCTAVTARFQSPSRGGHLCGPRTDPSAIAPTVFQSPSRGGHLCGRFELYARPWRCAAVSVPFTRGTPLWPCEIRRTKASNERFSPLHEGDTSVASYIRVRRSVP